ncbi:hypothetical protein [Streptosporangium vulgare]|uniref:hypothetical protein n=1 Tax=Streptosporangium vulgare TaxID=46190 RepID=UPI0031DA4B03
MPILGAPGVLATFIMRQFFISLPGELEEAARVDGLGRFGTFLQGRAAAGPARARRRRDLHVLHSWNLYPRTHRVPLLAGEVHPPQALTQFVDAYGGPMWNVQLAAASMTALPVLVVFVLAQRQFIEGLAHTRPEGLSASSGGGHPPIASSSLRTSAGSSIPAPATFSRRWATDDVPGMRGRWASGAAARPSGDLEGVARTSSEATPGLRTPDCRGVNPPRGKKGV